jgi:hypothetical protein
VKLFQAFEQEMSKPFAGEIVIWREEFEYHLHEQVDLTPNLRVCVTHLLTQVLLTSLHISNHRLKSVPLH